MANNPATPYSQATFLTTHNSFSNAEDGWVNYQQKDGIAKQLEMGVRGFMLDLWLETINGQEDIYLLHGGFKLTGIYSGFQFQTLADALQVITGFLTNHPSEVVTVFFETGKTARSSKGRTLVAQAIGQIRNNFLFDPSTGQGFHTPLNQMSRRLVIFSDYRGDDTHSIHPLDKFGLPAVWHYCIESVYGDDGLNSDSWAKERPESAASGNANRWLAIVNHFPTWALGTQLALGDATASAHVIEAKYFAELNSAAKVYSHVADFTVQHALVPNFVALDMAHLGLKPNDLVKHCNVSRTHMGTVVSLRGINGKWISTETAASRKWLYCKRDAKAKFTVVGNFVWALLEYVDPGSSETLYLDFRNTTGAAKLYGNKSDAHMQLQLVSDGVYRLLSLSRNQYLRLSNMSGDLYFEDGHAKDGSDLFELEVQNTVPALEHFNVQVLTPGNGSWRFTAPDGLVNGSDIVMGNQAPVIFERIGPRDRCVLRVIGSAEPLFLSYNWITNALKLYDEPVLWNILAAEVNGTAGYMLRCDSNQVLAHPSDDNHYVYLSRLGPYMSPFYQLLDPVLQTPL